ncbi:hypothetical protein [Amycolatopsis sp. cg13]
MLTLGIILLVFGIPVLWTVGIILAVAGAAVAIAGAAGRRVGGRAHWY